VSREDQLRKRAEELLAKKEVMMVIGYRAGKRPGSATPAFVTRPEDADVLIFDDRCGANLAAYLPRVKHRGRIAIVAKGCDSRSIVSLLKEKQVDRSQLMILGVGCEGVKLQGRLSDSCATCSYPNPVLCDEMVGEKVAERQPAPDPLAEFEKLTPDRRWQALSDDVSRCIRCYACRQVCPNCYCPTCFVDAGNPQWVGKTTAGSDNMMFHLMRAMHMAGRCVECGSCSRGCPMGIDLMKFNRKVAKVVKERFGAVAGLNPDEPPALAAFDPNDKQEFIQ
jgi:formate dehydrogenase (coenzyme F420) beta subunit